MKRKQNAIGLKTKKEGKREELGKRKGRISKKHEIPLIF